MHGASEFGELARAARLTSVDMLKGLKREIARAGKPARPALVTQIEASQPEAGGWRRTLIRDLRVRTKVDTGLTTASITIITYAVGRKRRRHLDVINKGRLRHPVWGNRGTWVTQRVKPEFWDRAMKQVEDQVESAVARVLDDTARQLGG